jgi:putative hydrolase of the HAD superfamily/pyrimidine and pyridine-specific 5'-nucleotidase
MTMSDLLLFCVTSVAFVVLQPRAPSSSFLTSTTTRDAKEHVCTVDEHNVPTATGHFRSEMRRLNLWHRATYIIVRRENEDKDIQILVQRRSTQKDYCPGRLDPTPGGVVGFQESYHENASREIEEEMGIDVSASSGNTMRKLFNFPFEDNRVRVWGGFFEVVYRGSLADLKIQEEEVDEVLQMSLRDVAKRAETNPDDWMPDSLHALKLYLQYGDDHSVNRRLLHGYSSGNLDAYKLRPKPKAIFFDCDDCLYFDNWRVASKLTHKMNEWCKNLGLKEGEAYELYQNHGTTLRGLLDEGHLEHSEESIDDFLSHVHDISVDQMLQEDKELRRMIEQMDPTIPKYIFTASVRHHAEACLTALGINDLFVDIIDVKACGLNSKHSEHSFKTAMKVAGVDDPESCLFLDDSVKNIQAARKVGWRSVLVGKIGRDCGKEISTDHAEHEIDRIHHLPKVMPELFNNTSTSNS